MLFMLVYKILQGNTVYTTISHFLIMVDYLLNGIIQVSECLNFSGNAVDNSW